MEHYDIICSCEQKGCTCMKFQQMTTECRLIYAKGQKYQRWRTSHELSSYFDTPWQLAKKLCCLCITCLNYNQHNYFQLTWHVCGHMKYKVSLTTLELIQCISITCKPCGELCVLTIEIQVAYSPDLYSSILNTSYW